MPVLEKEEQQMRKPTKILGPKSTILWTIHNKLQLLKQNELLLLEPDVRTNS